MVKLEVGSRERSEAGARLGAASLLWVSHPEPSLKTA